MFTLIMGMLLLMGCSVTKRPQETAVSPQTGMLLLPELEAIELDGKPLEVVATTSIIGNVVSQVGGDSIQLTTLIGAGQDPHSYEPGAQELTTVTDAHIIFVNGWDLEETLIQNIDNIGEEVPLIPVSANIAPLELGNTIHEDEHAQGTADPHTWLTVQNVKQWVQNIEHTLSNLDPANAETYKNNAAVYLSELDALETYTQTQLADIPTERRFLVTNHDALGYFVHEYGFELLGTIIPGSSTLAEPSASDLAQLIQKMTTHNICTIFTETAVSNKMAQTVAAELDSCDQIQILTLHTGTLGSPGSGVDSYIGMFRANVDTVVQGLKE
ncbi:MAG: zinc ABC transporter substrate-binding protein [Chloroflexi bacterium]|nr:zinc ABC transporter substrate-binding protein [Chloroflexota bacterium]